jgi:hypothetical protein
METTSHRSAGITASAVLSVLIGIAILLLWGFFFRGILAIPPNANGKYVFQLFPVLCGLIILVPPLLAAISIRMGIGLFQLRTWARKVALLWASFCSTFCLAIVALRPFETFFLPTDFVSESFYFLQFLALTAIVSLLPVSVWWLFYFRLASVKAQFEPL